MSIYKKNLSNIVSLIGDNAEVNKATANLCKIPLIGCSFHKLNLAINRYLGKHENLLNKINILMGKLRSLTFAGKLRNVTQLTPLQRNKTRWSSVYKMVNRYIELQPFLSIFHDDVSLIDDFLTPREQKNLLFLQSQLKNLNSITCALQRTDIDLYDARVLFDGVISFFDSDEFNYYLSPHSSIKHNMNFDNEVIKILQNNLTNLKLEEMNAINMLKEQSVQPVYCEQKDTDGSSDFALQLLKTKEDQKHLPQAYINCKFLVPTSNVLERFFSIAGYAFNEYRQSLSPLNLEMQLFLNVNRRFWNEDTVSEIVNENK